jgi:hypothetical protein
MSDNPKEKGYPFGGFQEEGSVVFLIQKFAINRYPVI